MDGENFNGQAGIDTKETTKKISDKVLGKCFGKMDISIEVIGIKEFKMDLVS